MIGNPSSGNSSASSGSTLDDASVTTLRSDYLWISPEGRAFPGVHHQLILQFLANASSLTTFSPAELYSIERQLKQRLPDIHVSYNDLEAIVQEFVALEPVVIQALTQRPLQQQISRQESDINSSIETSSIIPDPYLYEQAEAKLVEGYHRWQSTADCNDNVTFTHLHSDPFTPDPDPSTAENKQRHVSTTRESPDAAHSACHKGCCDSKTERINQDTYPIGYTPTQEYLDQNYNLTKPQNLPGQRQSTLEHNISTIMNSSSAIPSINHDVEITPENAHKYAPLYLAALTQMRYGATSIEFAPAADIEEACHTAGGESTMAPREVVSDADAYNAAGAPGELPTAVSNDGNKPISEAVSVGYPVMPKTRRPNPSSYIKQSNGRIVIPACEAEPFIAWFSPPLVSVPEKIEGYAWYCNRCYASPSTGGKQRLKGKFTTKTSTEKHYEKQHNEKWKPMLPELERERERETGMLPAPHAAKPADTGPKVYIDPPQPDHRSLNGLQTLDTPALMSLGDVYKYQPKQARRVLFRDELALRETVTNTAKRDGKLKFEDLQCENKDKVSEQKPRKRRYGGKESAWEAFTAQAASSTHRRVTFSEREDVQEFDSGYGEDDCCETNDEWS